MAESLSQSIETRSEGRPGQSSVSIPHVREGEDLFAYVAARGDAKSPLFRGGRAHGH